MEIKAKAQKDSALWKNLYFELRKTSEFEYSLQAFVTYESFRICDNVIVTRNTAILFQPAIKGT